MFGNAQGWVISAILAAGLWAAAIGLYRLSAISSPTTLGRDPENLAAVALPVAPETIQISEASCDAADLYRQAADDYDANKQPCDTFFQAIGKSAGDPAPPGPIALILKGAACKSLALFSPSPQELVNYDSRLPTLEALGKVGDDTVSAGMAYKARVAKDPSEEAKHDREKAMEYFQAAFALGQKLYHERITFDEYSVGVGAMAAAAEEMAAISQDPARAQELKAFDEGRLKYEDDHVKPIWRVLAGNNQEVIEQNAGDVFAFARDSHERMFRVQAVLMLGRMRYNAGRAGDQQAANVWVKRFEGDPDPAVRTAAKAAAALTLEEYRKLH